MMKKQGWTRTTAHGIREPRISYWITLWEQPLHRWLIARIYHWYDMWIYRVPGFRKLERWQANRSDDDFYIPLSNRQDLRCYHLSHKQKMTLVTLPMTEEQYKVFGDGRNEL